MTSVFDHPWLDALFGDDDVSELWSAPTQLEHFKAFEVALAEALEACGRVSPSVGRAAIEAITIAEFDISALADGTARDGLPIPSFARQLRAFAGPNSPAVHNGATSQDVLDTALALTLRELTNILDHRIQVLDGKLGEIVTLHGTRMLMGRTRMQAALPTTVSNRVEAWRRPLKSHLDGLAVLRPQVERLQLGGAVGDRAAFEPNAEEVASRMAARLSLENVPVWHTDRSSIADFAGRLSLISGTLGKMGQDVALMSQQGLDEIKLRGGGGSSAMPHKSNPINAELLVCLARFNATLLAGMHQAMIHEQERSGEAWMLEWMILPQMSVTTARSLAVATLVCDEIEQIGMDTIRT